MLSDPIISFIIPVYNGSKTISKCIHSILRQSVDLEVIVIDDGSIDNTIDIVKEIRDSRIRVIQQHNGGAARARNVGINSAVGRYVAFVDSDDWLKEDAYIFITPGLDADVILTDAHKVFPDGRLSDLGNGYADAFGTQRLVASAIRASCLRLRKMPAAPWDKIIKLDFAKKHLFPEGRFVEDLDWAMRIFADAESIRYIPVDAYLYRQSLASSSSARGMKFIEDYLWFFQKWIGYNGKLETKAMVNRFLTTQMYVFLGVLGQSSRKVRLANLDITKRLFTSISQQAIYVRPQEKIVIKIANILGVSLTSKLMGLALTLRTMREQHHYAELVPDE